MNRGRLKFSLPTVTLHSSKDQTPTHNEEKISNNLLTLFHIVKKKKCFTKPQKCSSSKQVHRNTNILLTYTGFCTWVTYSIAKRGILRSSNHSYSDRCQAQRKEATQLYQKWKAALCYPFPRQPAHKMRRTFSVLCQGFCVYRAVNCICFKVWDVSQGANGQVASPNAYINSKMRSPESSPQAGGPPCWQLPLAHTQ